MEDIVEEMRRDIKISNVRPLSQGERQISAFQISFSYENRILAQKVTADLVSRFMTENTRERTTQSVLTTQFLKDQLENSKKELETIEGKLTNFRTTANGRLPDQVQQNATQMAMLEQRIANLNAALARLSQDKMLLESDLRTAKLQRASLTPTSENMVRKQKNDRIVQIDRDIMQLEATLSNLRQHYKDSYPDVRRVQSQMITLQQMRAKVLEEEENDKEKEAETVVATKRVDPMYEREPANSTPLSSGSKCNSRLRTRKRRTTVTILRTPRRAYGWYKAALSRHPLASSSTWISCGTAKWQS